MYNISLRQNRFQLTQPHDEFDVVDLLRMETDLRARCLPQITLGWIRLSSARRAAAVVSEGGEACINGGPAAIAVILPDHLVHRCKLSARYLRGYAYTRAPRCANFTRFGRMNSSSGQQQGFLPCGGSTNLTTWIEVATLRMSSSYELVRAQLTRIH